MTTYTTRSPMRRQQPAARHPFVAYLLVQVPAALMLLAGAAAYFVYLAE
jgi:hypothetical protein